MSGDDYLLDNQQVQAGQRFDALASLFNASTFRHLDALGLDLGWRVWEVGAGGPSVPAWIASRTATTVLATDIDTTWLHDLGESVEVRRHDVGADPAPGGDFDLVHARLVLVHLPSRAEVAASLARALRPGGWLVLEDADPALQPLACVDERGPDEALANRIRAGFRALLAERGADLAFGRTLPRLLRDVGLVDVRADASFPVAGPVSAALERITVEQLRDALVGCGAATGAEIDRHLDNLSAGGLDVTTAPLVSARGRRPGAPAA